jgi:hypothetical protein
MHSPVHSSSLPEAWTNKPPNFSAIVKAAQEIPPFESMPLQLGEGEACCAQKLSKQMASDGALSSVKMAAAAVTIGFNLSLLTIEIIRDFWQIMSLVLTLTFTAPFSISGYLGRIAFFISLDFAFLVPPSVDRKTAYSAVWWILFIISIVATGYLQKLVKAAMPQPRREFVMLRTWAMLDRAQAVRMRGTIFVLTLIYLPVSQMALEMIMCSHKWYGINNGSCAEWYYVVSAIIILIVVTLYLPFNLFRIVRDNVPKDRVFDAAGESTALKHRENDYITDLARLTRKNPIAGLFNEYRRKMRFHKVTIMGLKLYLILVAVCLSGNNYTGFRYSTAPVPMQVGGGTTAPMPPPQLMAETDSNSYNHARPLLMMLGLAAYTLLCLVYRPFVSSLANVLDVILRILAFAAVLCAYLIMFEVGVDAVTVIFSVVLGLTLAVSVVFMLFAFDCVQERFRKTTGDVSLTAVSDERAEPLWFNVDAINWTKERKYRVWQHYWTMLLVHTNPFRLRPPPVELDADGNEIENDDVERLHKAAENADFEYVDNEDTVSYLLDFKGSVAERHAENIEIASDIGKDQFAVALSTMMPAEIESVTYATRALHGQDCFYQPEEGVGEFGCLYVLPVPYEFFFMPDNGADEKRITTYDTIGLMQTNAHPEIQRRRKVREQLRGLAHYCRQTGYDALFHFEEYQTIKIPDGTDQHGRAKYRSVQVLVEFNQGVLHVTHNDTKPVFKVPVTNSDTKMEIVPGFIVGLTFPRGHYQEHGGGQVGERTIGHDELGITPTFEVTPNLERLLNENISQVHDGYFEVLRLKDTFRRYFMSEFTAKAYTLSYAFWPAVFNNDMIQRDILHDHFAEYELNPHLRRLADAEQAPLLDVPYVRLAYYDSCPAVSLWVCFWHDVYHRNIDMSMIAEKDEVNQVLNPWVPTSLSWNVMAKSSTNAVLQAAGLQSESGGGFLNGKLIDELYFAMGRAMDLFDPENPTLHLQMTAPATPPQQHHDYFEIQRHAYYGPTLRPATMENVAHPDLALLARVPQNTNLFYPDGGDAHTHYQRYPILARAFGGTVPKDAYDP